MRISIERTDINHSLFMSEFALYNLLNDTWIVKPLVTVKSKYFPRNVYVYTRLCNVKKPIAWSVSRTSIIPERRTASRPQLKKQERLQFPYAVKYVLPGRYCRGSQQQNQHSLSAQCFRHCRIRCT